LLKSSGVLDFTAMSHLVFNRSRYLGNACVARSRFAISRQFIARGLLVALLATLGTSGTALPAIAQIRTQTQGSSKTSNVAEQLLGQWQAKDPASNKVITFIFAPSGNLFVVTPARDGSSVALKFGYKINSATQPMQLDMKLSPNDEVPTIFEVTPEGKLRLELNNIGAGQSRPTAFSANSTLFEKTSQGTTVPNNIPVVALETQQGKAGQNVVKQYITIINTAQQDYFQKKGKFAADIEELGIATTLETESYRYQIVPQGDRTQSATITAQPKKTGLPSYIGAVLVTQSNGKTMTISGICETEQASTSPPTIPTLPSSSSSQIQCPTGSRLLQ
jgi:hypothetical protein